MADLIICFYMVYADTIHDITEFTCSWEISLYVPGPHSIISIGYCTHPRFMKSYKMAKPSPLEGSVGSANCTGLESDSNIAGR